MKWSRRSESSKLQFVKALTEQERYERFAELFTELSQFSEMCGFGDPMSYARGREIQMAGALGHRISDTLSGADGIRPDGLLVEYKSTVGKHINGAYNGISVQGTWAEQLTYLKNEKIAKYPFHYFARFLDGEIVEMWEMPGNVVLRLLLPKLEKKYNRVRKLKDPRLGATITKAEINKYGTRLK